MADAKLSKSPSTHRLRGWVPEASACHARRCADKYRDTSTQQRCSSRTGWNWFGFFASSVSSAFNSVDSISRLCDLCGLGVNPLPRSRFWQTIRGRGLPRSRSYPFGATATSPCFLVVRRQRCYHRCYIQAGVVRRRPPSATSSQVSNPQGKADRETAERLTAAAR
jgi:hypothetical protein